MQTQWKPPDALLRSDAAITMTHNLLHGLRARGNQLLRAAFLSFLLVLLLPMASAFAAVELRTYIDTDNNAATGCTITTASGTFVGAEMAAVTRVDPSQPQAVGDISREICQSGVMVSDPSFVPLTPTRWALGIAAAGPQRDVVESYALSATPFTAARLGFTANTTDNSLPASALLSANGNTTNNVPIVLGNAAPAPTPLPAVMQQVPAVGAATVALLACIVFLVTRRFANKRQLASAGSALCLMLVVSLAWAASIIRDGSPTDWAQISPVANSASTGPLTIAAVYAQADGNTLNLRYDLDLGIRQNTPVEDAYSTQSGAPLSVSAPGVMGNDSPATPAALVREFRLQGTSSATAAGGSIALVGGALTVQADGSFTVTTSVVGQLKFEYLAHNGLSSGQWTLVTIDITNSTPQAVCGDGKITAPEVCDDGNTVTETSCPYGSPNCTSCNATCTATLQLSGPVCGDSIINGTEVCDDGNTVNETSCPYGSPNCTTCNATCTATLQLSGPVCGDGIKNGAEVCDDGNTVTETSCPYGSPNCTACNATCTATLQLSGPVCGDNIINGPEVCDDGNTINETSCSFGSASCTTCNADCTATLQLNGPVCGDGKVDVTEQCDDGNGNNNDGCTNACRIAVCGDGFVQTGVEQCDDGNSIDNDGCSNQCMFNAAIPICGNGVLETGEQCDDGNGVNGDGCSATCTLEVVKAAPSNIQPQTPTPTQTQAFQFPLPTKRSRINLLAPQ